MADARRVLDCLPVARLRAARKIFSTFVRAGGCSATRPNTDFCAPMNGRRRTFAAMPLSRAICSSGSQPKSAARCRSITLRISAFPRLRAMMPPSGFRAWARLVRRTLEPFASSSSSSMDCSSSELKTVARVHLSSTPLTSTLASAVTLVSCCTPPNCKAAWNRSRASDDLASFINSAGNSTLGKSARLKRKVNAAAANCLAVRSGGAGVFS